MTFEERVFDNPFRLLLSLVLANYQENDEPVTQQTT